MRFACWIIKTKKKHTWRIFHTYCFSRATMVTRTRLSLALYKYIALLVCAV